jgi:putative intracellular protease/amidase
MRQAMTAEVRPDEGSVANWHSNVVVDHELITGQQPMSAPELGDVLVAKLKQHAHH